MSNLPTYVDLYNGIILVLSKNPKGLNINDISNRVAVELNLTSEQLSIPSKNDSRSKFEYNLAWARTNLKRSGLIYNPSRGFWTLTRSQLSDGEFERRYEAFIDGGRSDSASYVITPKALPSRRDPLPPIPPSPTTQAPESWDFFVSYSHYDQAVAHEVVGVVEGLGFSAFVQFRDMGPGANFVRDMQRGLAASARVIALYSPEYEASPQCQAEWSAAYNADPSGEKRKLLPFLLRPTRLSPLAQQVVYKSLVGLSPRGRHEAIIEAIRHNPQHKRREVVAAELAASASPDVIINAAGKIDTAPNAKFDFVVATSNFDALRKRQQFLCRDILKYASGNTPAMFRGCFKNYREHVSEPIHQIFPGVLDDQWKMACAYLVGSEAIDFDGGLKEALALFSQNHSELITHFPLREDRERLLLETMVDEEAAVGEALTDPIESVKHALEAAADQDQATSAVVAHVMDLAERADALAPPITTVPNERTTVISARRRLVLTSLGFFERLYAAVGSTASVLSTETGRSLYNAARDAVDGLMRLIK